MVNRRQYRTRKSMLGTLRTTCPNLPNRVPSFFPENAFFSNVYTDVCENNVCSMVVFCGRTKLPVNGAWRHDESSDTEDVKQALLEALSTMEICGGPVF